MGASGVLYVCIVICKYVDMNVPMHTSVANYSDKCSLIFIWKHVLYLSPLEGKSEICFVLWQVRPASNLSLENRIFTAMKDELICC